MRKTTTDTVTRRKKHKGAFRRLKRNGGQRRTKSAALTCYLYQKEELIKRAHEQGMTISYYLNYLLWKDWIE